MGAKHHAVGAQSHIAPYQNRPGSRCGVQNRQRLDELLDELLDKLLALDSAYMS